MTKYKLFRYLHILTFAERKEIGKYLAGLKQKDCLRLYKNSIKLMTSPVALSALKSKLFKQVFPGLPYDDARMRKLMGRLTQILKEYLIKNALAENEGINQGLLVKTLFQRSDYKLFLEAAEMRIRELERQKKRGQSYFREKSQLFQSIYFHPETEKFTVKNDYFQQAVFYQERYFVLSALITGAENLSRNKTINTSNEYSLLKPALQIAKNMGEECPPVISLFCDLVGLLWTKDSSPNLKKLKNLLFSNIELMEPDEQRMAIKLLIMYATPFSNHGEKEYTRFIFDLYKLGIDQHLLKQGNTPLGTIPFLNIVFTGANVGELLWTKKFIAKHHRELPYEEQSPALNLSWAAWHYKKGMMENIPEELKEALSLLNLIPTRSDEIFDLRTRSLYLRIIFDLFLLGKMEFDTVMENARNFERHLTANKTYSIAKKNAYLLFVDYCRQLAKLSNKEKKRDFTPFINKLKKDENCVLRHWLLEKAEETIASSAQKN